MDKQQMEIFLDCMVRMTDSLETIADSVEKLSMTRENWKHIEETEEPVLLSAIRYIAGAMPG